MLIVGVGPLVAGVDIGEIARAATLSASFPAFFVYWSITRIPKKFPNEYARSAFRLPPFWLWLLFWFSMLSTLVGIYFLAQDLSRTTVITFGLWLIISIVYYPLRKRYLARQSIDLDRLTSDRGIFQNN